jgi:hypothetical protein
MVASTWTGNRMHRIGMPLNVAVHMDRSNNAGTRYRGLSKTSLFFLPRPLPAESGPQDSTDPDCTENEAPKAPVVVPVASGSGDLARLDNVSC